MLPIVLSLPLPRITTMRRKPEIIQYREVPASRGNIKPFEPAAELPFQDDPPSPNDPEQQIGTAYFELAASPKPSQSINLSPCISLNDFDS